MRGAESTVTTKVRAAVAASTRSTCHSDVNTRGLINPITAATTTADSTALGTWYSAGVRNSSTSSTIATAAMVAQPVFAPAYSVIAERENDVLVGKLPENAEASLPTPWPTRSWLASQRLPSRWFSILALDAISIELTSASTTEGATSARSVSQSGSDGTYRCGSPAGNWPTTLPRSA